MYRLAWFALILPFFFAAAVAQETPAPQAPHVAAASPEAEQAMENFIRPEGVKIELFAAEPDVANIVAFAFDNQGRVYVCETFRQQRGVEDNRGHGHWLDDDLAAQTVADRLAYINKHLGERAIEYTEQDDRIRLLEDADGDGRADRATVFADRFNTIVSGTGAGVLAHNGNVYYTCIPDLWLLRDEDGDGQADVRKSLHTGYGVRFAFRGHDMHGLCLGPDGRLYFSIGDRGFNVETEDGRIVHPQCGAVLRCDRDGSNLELFATGLRNPQELAFDDYGNLFTGDNNSDSGDKARWVYVVQGGDSGWRMEYQYLPDRGPWNREKLWHPFHEDQAAYIVPPVANIADGPSGLTYYPGTGFGEEWRGRFFLADFRGTPLQSGVRSFLVKPQGAFFELVDAEQPIWQILATDVDFGPDGSLYISDWVDGWDGLGKGRIYRFFDPAQRDAAVVQEVQRLLAEGFAQGPIGELIGLLSHADRRIRLEAQFALAEKRATDALAKVVSSSENQLARLHGIWGLGQIARMSEKRELLEIVARLLGDTDAEVRAQAAKTLGDNRYEPSREQLINLLNDDSSRVRYFAAVALGKLGSTNAIPAVAAMLAENDNADPVLRHGGAMALAGTGDPSAIIEAAAKHPSVAVRLAAAVALRKLASPAIAEFLRDPEERVILEAARAVHDLPVAVALPELASLASRDTQNDALLRRALNANFRLGKAENAAAVANVAGRDSAPEAMRLEALAMLETWGEPSPKDRVLNFWRPLPQRDPQIAAAAMKPALPGIFTGPEAVREAGARVAARYGVIEAAPALRNLLADDSQRGAVRSAALEALAALQDEGLRELAEKAIGAEDAVLRAGGRRVLAELDPQAALPLLDTTIYNGELVERQGALAALARVQSPEAANIVSHAMDNLLAGRIPADTQLDVLLAAEAHRTPEIEGKLSKYEATREPDDPLSVYREASAGGNAERGRRIFFEKTDVACVRCHEVQGTGGEVGPDLTNIGADKKRDYLLEAIVAPSRTIAKNFETAVVATEEGFVHTGVVKFEDEAVLRLVTAEGKQITIDKETIEERRTGKSAMPEDLLKHLTRPDIRDLVEFLANLKKGPETHHD
ncbi:MAG: HEAT repeat domain-containing protein [Planctomycetes bacterium]|nr:HEAT repeat domain-containing protein [Planctomycetota bacterium]